MSNSTITLQNVINFASTHADLMPLSGVGGYTSEPALSICNSILEELLSAPLAWKFNSIAMPMLVTSATKQDYTFAGAVAFTLGSNSAGAAIALASANAITEVGNTVTVNTLEAHALLAGDTVYMFGNTVAAYNSSSVQTAASYLFTGGWVITGVTTTSFTFVHATSGLGVSGAPGITDFGWLESGTMTEMNNSSSPQNLKYLEAVRTIQPSCRLDNPQKVSVVKDNGDGTLKIRFQYVPGSTVWGVNLIYQAKALLKTALTDNWAPFPDNLSFVIRQGTLAYMYRYLNSPRADVEYTKLGAAISRALGADDRETSDTHCFPESSLLDNAWGGYVWLLDSKGFTSKWSFIPSLIRLVGFST